MSLLLLKELIIIFLIMWNLLGKGERKLFINGHSHMTKMAAMPIYGKKNFKNILLQNRKSYDLETRHVQSRTQVYKVYINYDPGLTFTYL